MENATKTMTPLVIPESAFEALQNLIHFTDDDFELFLSALSKAEPSLDRNKFWSHVTKYAPKIPEAVIESILNEIFQMDDVRPLGLGIDEFSAHIAEAAIEANSDKFPIKKGEEKILQSRLLKIFEGRKGLDVTMKSMAVLADQANVFYRARVLTDIRPVFNKAGDSVDAAVIVHNMRIHYGADDDHKDFYVALDTRDIQSLREALDRADRKAKCLQQILKASKVSYLDAEE